MFRIASYKTISLYACLIVAFAQNCYGVDIFKVRQGIHEDKTRLVLDMSHEDRYSIVGTQSQKHFQIRLPKTQIPTQYMSKQKGKNHIRAYYFTPGPKKAITLHIETKQPCLMKIFTVPSSPKEPFRIVIDIKPSKGIVPSKAVTTETKKSSIPTPLVKPHRRTVVIDAGHGGQDPGTISNGIEEKHITLAVAKEVQRALEKSGKYMTVLTRKDDKHLPLRYRFSVAREMEADLLISLHADSHPDKNVKGVSVYTLSEKASDKEAQRLADKENSADFLEDLKFTGQTEPEIKDILINLSQTRAKNHSIVFANKLMNRLKGEEVLLKNSHRSADFAVLKAPDVASVLIELGYLSNASDQKRLVSPSYQRKIAARIAMAIEDYFEHIKP